MGCIFDDILERVKCIYWRENCCRDPEINCGNGDALCNEMICKSVELKRQITYKDEALHRKNIALDALHYVWCDGGCEGGVHRYDEERLTEEIILAAESNTVRLRRWFQNNKTKNDTKETA